MPRLLVAENSKFPNGSALPIVILYQTMLNKIKWRQRVENDNGD
jgi:hypothetical protein